MALRDMRRANYRRAAVSCFCKSWQSLSFPISDCDGDVPSGRRNLGSAGRWRAIAANSDAGENISSRGDREPFLRDPVSFWGDEDEGDHRHENRISRCDCDSCSCRWYWAGSQFCRLAVFPTAVDAGCRSIGVSCVRGSVRASVRWLRLAQLKTQTALPRPWGIARSAERPARRQSAHVDP